MLALGGRLFLVVGEAPAMDARLVTRTAAELSIVCEASRVPAEVPRVGPWRALEVQLGMDEPPQRKPRAEFELACAATPCGVGMAKSR
jgi:hypothetical protein